MNQPTKHDVFKDFQIYISEKSTKNVAR